MLNDTNLSKRNFLKVGGVAALGSLTLCTASCGPSMNTWVQTIIGGLEELKPLLPAQGSLLTKAISTAKSFNEAWQDGKFANAAALLENLTATIQQVIDDAGVNVSQQVKTMIAVVGVALRTIAVLMKEQMGDPVVAAAVRDKTANSPSAAMQRSVIERLADPNAVNAVFAAARP